MKKEVHIIKVGGSILSLSEDDIFSFEMANNLKQSILKHIDKSKFVLCVGGGYLSRKYQMLMKEQNIDDSQQHNIGVASINMNAVMLRAVFEDYAEEEILKYHDYDLDTLIKFDKSVLVTAAGSPGHSSDWNTTKIAIRTGSKKIISLKNIDGVYTADPKKDKNAKKIDHLTWNEYINIIGNPSTFEPGGNYPVDIYAAKLAQENNIKFYIISGNDFINMHKVFNNEEFNGTIIS